MYESQFPEKLMAQYDKNMSGGIMAEGKPKEKSSVELLAEYDYKIGWARFYNILGTYLRKENPMNIQSIGV